MPLRSDWSTEYCPIRRSLDVLGDPWVLLIVRDVLHGTGRFEQLRDNLGISEAVLSRRLRAMREAGLLDVVDYERGGRTRQRYVATPAAADLLPLLHHLAIWGEKHTVEPDGGAHMALVHQPCGRETTDGERCSSCGEPLRPEDMTWVKPWLGTEHQLRPAGA
ncbi:MULTISPECIES: winged helix-turn-helix transcriptional regulator [unclassified Nocardioides]|uniref:winged helix-turn-helix transcriptional regulator n=1 Tax=unclassified Nocardioides TaxID=2615069 RepID=UPI0007028ADA|nr:MULTISPECIES: helix-turn-helix domain-containing protein [unclassified Nocardioides]KRC53319.1 HxlR family transcriptional regulator [Nocardioides sp. Root79]KRC70656.1 HxlR family transcriptional regulator [Nocardioides sp. Root240]